MSVHTEITHKGVNALILHRGSNLTSLSLVYPCATDIEAAIGLYCVNLTHLSLMGYSLHFNFGVNLRNCSMLTSLTLSRVDVRENLNVMLTTLPEVKVLRYCEVPNDALLKAITSEWMICKAIEHLDLSGWKVTSIKDIGTYARSLRSQHQCLMHVVELNLSHSIFSGDDATNLIFACDQLKRLKLSHCEWVTDDVIQRLANHTISNIELVDLSCCHGYTIFSILSLLKYRLPPKPTLMYKLRRNLTGSGGEGRKLRTVTMTDCCTSCQDKATLKHFHSMLGSEGMEHVHINKCEKGFVACMMHI